MRITCGAPGGSEAWRALAAAITSITMNGGALAPRPTFSTSIPAGREPGVARIGCPAAGAVLARQVSGAGYDVGAPGIRDRRRHRLTGAQRVQHPDRNGHRRARLAGAADRGTEGVDVVVPGDRRRIQW